MRAIPHTIREAAYALGATQWQVTPTTCFPTHRRHHTGVIIGLVAGDRRDGAADDDRRADVHRLPAADADPARSRRLFRSTGCSTPFTVLPIQMFNWVSRPGTDFQRNAAAAGLVLLVLTLSLNAGAVTSVTGCEDASSGERTRMTQAAVRTAVPAPGLDAIDRGRRRDRKPRSRKLRLLLRRKQALKNINLSFADSQVTAIIGPSGCGKSTLLRCFNRMHDLYPGNRYEGEILLYPDGLNIVGPYVDPVEMRMRIGMVFQKPNPFPKSIFENVAFGLRFTGSGTAASSTSGSRQHCAAALWEEVKDRLPSRHGALRRPAAAAVHRPRAGHRSGNPAVRRTDFGARPDRHRAHRRTDLRAERAGDDRHRHAQHAAGGAGLGRHGVHVPWRTDRIRPPPSRCSQTRGRSAPGLHQPAVSADERLRDREYRNGQHTY